MEKKVVTVEMLRKAAQTLNESGILGENLLVGIKEMSKEVLVSAFIEGIENFHLEGKTQDEEDAALQERLDPMALETY